MLKCKIKKADVDGVLDLNIPKTAKTSPETLKVDIR